MAELLTSGSISDGMTPREAKRKSKSLASVIDSGLTTLERLGWVKLEEIETGGRPSEIVRVHPDLRKGGAM